MKAIPACPDCAGQTHTLCRRVVKGGAIQVVYQCAHCGRATSSALSRSHLGDINSYPMFDETMKARHDAAKAAIRLANSAARQKDWFAQHADYLQTAEWHSLRDRVFARAGGICEGCAMQRAVHVHHLTYEHWKRELLWELVAVCLQCHERAHVRLIEGGPK